MVISHDRELLNNSCDHILHLKDGKLELYAGGYDAFERQLSEKLRLQEASRAKIDAKRAHLQSFVDRFRAKASKATQAQSRMKMIERIQLVAPVIADNEFTFTFRTPDKLPSPLVRLDQVAVGYDGHPQLAAIKLGIEPGERVGLLGVNGAGKSTFVRLLAGELSPLAGQCVRSPDLVVGYFAQHQLEQLDPAASPLLHLKRMDPQAREQDLRNYLGSFNFRGDRAFEAIEPFSGGEKPRLALALVVYPKPNLLLLDEPTNHLDLDMRQALEIALNDYEGAMVLVSHDRHLVGSVCDRLWRVADHRVTPFDGDLEDYAKWLQQRGRETPASPAAKATAKTVSAKTVVEAPRAAAPAPSKEEVKELRANVRKHETRMNRLQELLQRVEVQLNDPGLYEGGDKAKAATLMREQAQLKDELGVVEEAWLMAAGELEKIGR
jgi:ATP-binding cassette subfamily F protein 3